jgi:DNA-binding CsgD family transcriptional regulator
MRSTRGGASPVMIGRDRELRQLAQLANARRPQVAIVAGEPGIGKSRLIRELRSVLPAETVVLVGQADPGSLARPYEVLMDALDGRADVDPAGLHVLSDGSLSPVERLHAGLTLVNEVTAGRPSVVVFEDLHWADSESAALFERLADHSGPRLLIGTYRPGDVAARHPLTALLGRMHRRHAVTQLALDRLGEADTASLLAAVTGRPAPYRAVAALHQRTGGNPFFLEELLRGHEDGDLACMYEDPLPWSLAEVLRRQVEDLAPQQQAIVEAAAVLGHRIPFDLLATVTGAGERDLIAVLNALVAQGVLVESGEDEFSFRHALQREAIAGHLLGRQRRRLHEAALEALLASGGDDAGDAGSDPAMIAHHAQAAGRYDDMVAAARRGAALYLSIGSAYQALLLAEMGLEEAGEDSELLGAAARAAWLAGLLADAIGYARRWRDRAGGASARAEALYLMIRLAYEADQVDEMVELTREVEQLIAQLPPGAEQAVAMTAVAQSAMLRDDPQDTVCWADRALALAAEFDLPRIRLAALVDKGIALSGWPDSAIEGERILSGLIEEAEAAGEWVLAARALNRLVQSMLPSSPAEHARLLERMRVNAERAGFESLAVAAYFQGRARVAMREGDLRSAIAALESGRDRDRWYQRNGRGAEAHGPFLAGLYLEAGELDGAAEIIADLRQQTGLPELTVPGLAFHLACRRDDLGAAREQLREVFAAMVAQTWRSGAQAHDLVSAALHVGLPLDELERTARELLADDVWDEYRTLIGAQLAEARGETAVALAGYQAVRESPVLYPAMRGTVAVGIARCLLSTGDVAGAAGQAAAAGELLARWGGWRVAQLEQLMAALGLTPVDGQRAVSGTAALTPREREVALLIAEGLSNADLARRLYISPKTAAVHVSSILHKLGVASRTQVAQLVR